MPYKVFLVEDEVVTREGIRDNVNWQRAGFSFCGEAPDGELALPLIQSMQPDLLITDIKMPFMDGLTLSRLVRDSMPHVRIVILSGHDEFEYARAAISLGVSDYLLKPLGVRELEELLQKIRAQLDEERADQHERRLLEAQVEVDNALRRDRFLLRLLTVGAPPAAAIEEARTLGCSISAAYQVVIVRTDFAGAPVQDFAEQEKYHAEVEALSATIRPSEGSWQILRKDIDESVLVAKGASEAQVQGMTDALLAAAQNYSLQDSNLRAHAGKGTPQARLHQLNLSYAAALYNLHAAIRRQIREEIGGEINLETVTEKVAETTTGATTEAATEAIPGIGAHATERPTTPRQVGKHADSIGSTLVTLHRAALADFLRSGLMEEFEEMFDRYMGTTFGAMLDDRALQNPLIENYVRTDMALTIAKFVIQLGANPTQLFAELGSTSHPGAPATMQLLRAQLREACLWALDLRDHRASNRNAALVQKAMHFMDLHFSDPTLSLAKVAADAGLSPNHFSTVFSAETGVTFRDHLSELRIARARELLRSTAMSNSEISDAAGYSDPHYFGAVFKRMTGQTPQQYRG